MTMNPKSTIRCLFELDHHMLTSNVYFSLHCNVFRLIHNTYMHLCLWEEEEGGGGGGGVFMI